MSGLTNLMAVIAINDDGRHRSFARGKSNIKPQPFGVLESVGRRRGDSLPSFKLHTQSKGVAATVKRNRNETCKSRGAGIRQANPVESFAGRGGLQPASKVENPCLNLTFGCRAGKTGYAPVQDNRRVPRPPICPAPVLAWLQSPRALAAGHGRQSEAGESAEVGCLDAVAERQSSSKSLSAGQFISFH